MNPILPNSTIGVFGSGQLGRMLAIEAVKMGYRIATFSPRSETPTGQIADVEIVSPYEDLQAVRDFAKSVDIVTFEFENVPSETIEAAAEFAQVHPKGEILHTTQNRLREKTFLSKNGFPVANFRHIRSLEDLSKAIEDVGSPGILKTAGFGYDGKGQSKIESRSDIERAFEKLGKNECVLEELVDFEKEVSVVCARDIRGNFVHYGVIENDHANHILDVSFAPPDVSEKVRKDAVEIARGIAEKFEYVGTMCVEFFLLGDESLIVNEIAPRPHNSGHLTFETSCITSQFEQQLRAVCGLPLGSTEFLRPVAMANLLGEIWQEGEPDWSKVLENKNVKLHLYGKQVARIGRKMGHITGVAKTASGARDLVIRARASIKMIS